MIEAILSRLDPRGTVGELERTVKAETWEAFGRAIAHAARDLDSAILTAADCQPEERDLGTAIDVTITVEPGTDRRAGL